jgi:hypothetical protein
VPAILDATLFGVTLHLLVSDAVSGPSLLNIIAPGDSTAALRTIAPSLEDVFVTLSRAQSPEAA